MFFKEKDRILTVLVTLVFLLASLAYGVTLEEKRSFEKLAVFNALIFKDKLVFLESVMEKEGIVAGWKLLESADVPSVGPLPYFVGTYIYKKHGSQGIKLCPNSFRLGCRGGLLKAAVAAEGLNVIKDLKNECASKGLGKTCGHGFGHGLSKFTNFDIKKSLEYCDQLRYAKVPCYGGVFQEYWEFGPEYMFSKDDVWKMCRDLPERHLSVCAFNLRDMWEARYQLDNSESMALCVSADERTTRVGCLLGAGFKIVKQNNGKVRDVITSCNEVFPEKYRPLCFISASNVFVVYAYDDWRNSVKAVCNELNGEMKSACRNAAEIQTLFETETVLKEFLFY